MGRLVWEDLCKVRLLLTADDIEENSRSGRNRLLDLHIDQWRCTCRRSSEGPREQWSKCSDRDSIENNIGPRHSN